MEKFQRIKDIWNWLPAFRAVAETEHLPTASSRAHVSASALSRSVSRLEDYLEVELFDRDSGSMELNENGERLLRAVRSSMRNTDDALQAILDETYRGSLKWASSWCMSGLTLEAIEAFTENHPDAVPKMRSLEADRVADQLIQGQLDIAILLHDVDREALDSRHIGDIHQSVYCGPSNPLYGDDSVSIGDLEGRTFAAPIPNEDGIYPDGWPRELDRNVVMEFERMAVGYRACRDQGLLALLPDIVGREETGLCKLVEDVGRSQKAFAVRRRCLDEHNESPLSELVELLREVFAERIGRRQYREEPKKMSA